MPITAEDVADADIDIEDIDGLFRSFSAAKAGVEKAKGEMMAAEARLSTVTADVANKRASYAAAAQASFEATAAVANYMQSTFFGGQ